MRVPSVVFGKMSLFVKNVIARLFFNLTHVVTRSVSLILLKSGFVAYQLKHLIGFCYNASYIWRIRERGHGDMSLRARHLPKWRIFYPNTHGFPDCAPFVRRSSVVHNCFIRFFRILSVGHGSQAALSSSAPSELFRDRRHFPQAQSCAISAVFLGFDVNFFYDIAAVLTFFYGMTDRSVSRTAIAACSKVNAP